MCGRRAKTLRRLGVTILSALSNLGSAMALYSAFIYVAAVLMVQFQAGKLRYLLLAIGHFCIYIRSRLLDDLVYSLV
jgi:hypothetical protein